MSRPRPRLSDTISNWSTYDGSVAKKVKLAARNNLIKLRTGSECCGNHGEPGC